MPGDPGEVLRMHAVVGVQVGDQDLVELVALIGQDPDHPAAAPVHRRGLADHDAGLERVFHVIEAAQPATELRLQARDVLPAWLIGVARDDRHHLQLVRIVGVDDRLHRALEHVVGLGVGGDDREMDVTKGVSVLGCPLFDAQRIPVANHVAAHPEQRAVHAPHDRDRPDEPVDVEEQHRSRHGEGAWPWKNDRYPRRGQEEDPRHQPGGGLEQARAKLAQRLLRD